MRNHSPLVTVLYSGEIEPFNVSNTRLFREARRGGPFLSDGRRREEILNGLRGVVLEREVCGVRIYHFTQ